MYTVHVEISADAYAVRLHGAYNAGTVVFAFSGF
jgi:hypothetical protein